MSNTDVTIHTHKENGRQFEGVVTRAPKQKTIAVVVHRVRMHGKYRKQYRVTRTYQVHDERNQAAVGDAVVFEECRPLSRTKRWRLRKIISHSQSAPLVD